MVGTSRPRRGLRRIGAVLWIPLMVTGLVGCGSGGVISDFDSTQSAIPAETDDAREPNLQPTDDFNEDEGNDSDLLTQADEICAQGVSYYLDQKQKSGGEVVTMGLVSAQVLAATANELDLLGSPDLSPLVEAMAYGAEVQSDLNVEIDQGKVMSPLWDEAVASGQQLQGIADQLGLPSCAELGGI